MSSQNKETNVYAKLRKKSDEYAGKRNPDQLQPGHKYTCYQFSQRKSDFADKKGEFPMTLVAYITDVAGAGTNKYYLTMPTFYNNLSEDDVKQLNDAVSSQKPPFLVFYGKDGVRNDLVLHEFGESIDEAKLTAYNLKKENKA